MASERFGLRVARDKFLVCSCNPHVRTLVGEDAELVARVTGGFKRGNKAGGRG